MTKEQTAELIGQGGNDELLPLMWEKVRGLFRRFSVSYYARYEERCRNAGVTVDDLHQESYLAMLEAVTAFCKRPEEQKELSFISFCKFPFRNHANELTGRRTARGQNDPLNNSRKSLDEPLTDFTGGDMGSLGDSLTDENAAAELQEAEDRVYYSDIHKIIEAALGEIPEKHAQAVRERYWNGKTLKEAGEAMGVSTSRIQQLEREALRKLRRLEKIQALHTEISYRTVSAAAQLRNGSAVEQEVERRERLREMLFREFAPDSPESIAALLSEFPEGKRELVLQGMISVYPALDTGKVLEIVRFLDENR